MKPTKEERIRYHVDCKDTAFSAYARLLQSKWREKKGFPRGKYGNYLELDFAKQSRANYLTDNIGELVKKSIMFKQKGAVILEPRIWDNLLSSQPLCFNLFGELYYDLNLATKFFKELFPGKIDNITAIKFEYSPGRESLKYTSDNSAFDVFVEYNNGDKKGFIGIEVKYAESLKEEDRKKAERYFKDRYETITNTSGIFKVESVSSLCMPPLSQIWRDHLLSITTKQDYDEGFFIFLYPKNNKECDMGVESYKDYLITNDEEQTGFYSRHLEDFIFILHNLANTQWSKELIERYLGPQ